MSSDESVEDENRKDCGEDELRKAIVVGASSGIGEGLARTLSDEGYIVGLAARREDKLLALQEQLVHKSIDKCIDISYPAAKEFLEEIIKKMEGVDLMIISSRVGHLNPDLNVNFEKETIDVNVKNSFFIQLKVPRKCSEQLTKPLSCFLMIIS